MDFFFYILAGAGVGLAVGLTGIGGGSLMTPLLILFGFPHNIAIGTDLLYAAITKGSGVFIHNKQKTVRWDIVKALLLGSLPASIGTAVFLKLYFPDTSSYQHILTISLGVMLIVTSLVILFKSRIQASANTATPGPIQNFARRHTYRITFAAGLLLGVCVTLSSVGAGAFGTAVLLILYPRLSTIQIVGTDLAHAVPLTLVAGLSHLFLLNNVDFLLLASLLVGSLPAIYVGTKLASRLPDKMLQPILASTLLLLGLKFTFF